MHDPGLDAGVHVLVGGRAVVLTGPPELGVDLAGPGRELLLVQVRQDALVDRGAVLRVDSARLAVGTADAAGRRLGAGEGSAEVRRQPSLVGLANRVVAGV